MSTTLDFAERLLIVEVEQGREVSRRELKLSEEAVEAKARKISAQGIQVVLCGAISRPLAMAISRAGTEIVPYVSGQVDQVLDAFLRGQLAEPSFLQPGCGPGARKRWRNRCGLGGGNFGPSCRT